MDNLRFLLDDLRGVHGVTEAADSFREDLEAYSRMTKKSEKRTYIVRSALHQIARVLKQTGGKVTKLAIRGKGALSGGVGIIQVTVPEGTDWGRNWVRDGLATLKQEPVFKYVGVVMKAGQDPHLTMEITYQGGEQSPSSEDLRR